jgi:hypothetical protein
VPFFDDNRRKRALILRGPLGLKNNPKLLQINREMLRFVACQYFYHVRTRIHFRQVVAFVERQDDVVFVFKNQSAFVTVDFSP